MDKGVNMSDPHNSRLSLTHFGDLGFSSHCSLILIIAATAYVLYWLYQLLPMYYAGYTSLCCLCKQVRFKLKTKLQLSISPVLTCLFYWWSHSWGEGELYCLFVGYTCSFFVREKRKHFPTIILRS